jgi:hypothetical protein
LGKNPFFVMLHFWRFFGKIGRVFFYLTPSHPASERPMSWMTLAVIQPSTNSEGKVFLRAVERGKKLLVNKKMLSGDNPTTFESTSTEQNILGSNPFQCIRCWKY